MSAGERRDRVLDDELSAKRRLHMVVNRLRQGLGEANRVVTRAGGYAAVVDPEELDRLVFRRYVETGDFKSATALRPRLPDSRGGAAWIDEERLVIDGPARPALKW